MSSGYFTWLECMLFFCWKHWISINSMKLMVGFSVCLFLWLLSLYLIWKVITFLGTVNFLFSQNSNMKKGFIDISVSMRDLVLITLRMGANIWIFHNVDVKQYLVPKTWWDLIFLDRYLYCRRFVGRKETLSLF